MKAGAPSGRLPLVMHESVEPPPSPSSAHPLAGLPVRMSDAVGRMREFFLLRDAERTARSYADEQAALLRTVNAAGQRRLAAATQLDTSLTRVAECILLSEALRCFLRAAAVAAGSQTASAAGEREIAVFRELGLGEATLVSFDQLSSPDLDVLRERLRDAIDAVRGSLEVRTPMVIGGTRIARVALLVGVVAWLLWSVTAAALRPANLARGKPVTASSRYVGTGDPSGVVDGTTTGTFGVHTQLEDSPWIIIDLSKAYAVRTIKVYNRGDGWFDIGLPLVAELSVDQAHWTEVGRRMTHFNQDPPWQIEVGGRVGRYLRLHVAGRGIISLRQVEVFEKK